MGKETHAEIVSELCTTIRMLGGKSDILATVGSWGDTLTDDEVLTHLREWNRCESHKGDFDRGE